MSALPAAADGSARRRPSAWGWLVTVSACLIAGFAVALGAWWIVSSHTRLTTYDVRGSLSAATLDLQGAGAEIVGGSETGSIRVERTDRYSFGHHPTATRVLDGSQLRLRSRCPDTVVGSCDERYRITVPSNVAIIVTTTTGDVTFDGYRGSARITTTAGDVSVRGYCGFALQARTTSGDIHATTVCAPERLTLRTGSGDASAVVPPGRYRIDAASNTGIHRVRGLRSADDSQFQIQVLSGSGDVSVDAPSS